jgi:lipopolysaccharide transport system ATP-binding protein
MNDTAIRVQNLSKRYRIGQARQRHDTLRDALMSGLRACTSHFRRNGVRNRQRDTIWALKDVSFDVKRGEVVGIIGRNGAGKSTLLKILSRITEPTEGQAMLDGRVGSLLEVGTGFHPELTGRENIYLNGAILGLRKAEIDRRYDAIVAFADVGKFVDTPIKHYSNGMHVRLAFAVAAHLESEIMLIDEVLAVGDIDFQKKCIGSMQSVANNGRTVLVVSHNMALIESLCGRAIWLDRGKIRSQGITQNVVADYLAGTPIAGTENLLDRPHHGQYGGARFAGIQLSSTDGTACRQIQMGSGLTFQLEILAEHPINKPWVGIQIRTSLNQLLFHMANREAGFELAPICGRCIVRCHIEELNLLPGRYLVELTLADMSNRQYDRVPSATYFDVRSGDVLDTGMPMDSEFGLLYFASHWEQDREGKNEEQTGC